MGFGTQIKWSDLLKRIKLAFDRSCIDEIQLTVDYKVLDFVKLLR